MTVTSGTTALVSTMAARIANRAGFSTASMPLLVLVGLPTLRRRKNPFGAGRLAHPGGFYTVNWMRIWQRDEFTFPDRVRNTIWDLHDYRDGDLGDSNPQRAVLASDRPVERNERTRIFRAQSSDLVIAPAASPSVLTLSGNPRTLTYSGSCASIGTLLVEDCRASYLVCPAAYYVLNAAAIFSRGRVP